MTEEHPDTGWSVRNLQALRHTSAGLSGKQEEAPRQGLGDSPGGGARGIQGSRWGSQGLVAQPESSKQDEVSGRPREVSEEFPADPARCAELSVSDTRTSLGGTAIEEMRQHAV